MVSAIVDALRDYGVRDIKMPATPFAVWQAIQRGKGGGAYSVKSMGG
jgi:aerobic carbon-monoxide dehydrogenase large subunit